MRFHWSNYHFVLGWYKQYLFSLYKGYPTISSCFLEILDDISSGTTIFMQARVHTSSLDLEVCVMCFGLTETHTKKFYFAFLDNCVHLAHLQHDLGWKCGMQMHYRNMYKLWVAFCLINIVPLYATWLLIWWLFII